MSPKSEKQFEVIREERKTEILSAALKVFAQHGYHGASVSQIAKQANVSKGLMYNYFESKQQVLRELLKSLFEKVVDTMDLQSEEKFTPDYLVKYVHETFRILETDRDSWKLYFSLIAQQEVMEISKEEMLPRMQPFMMGLMQFFQEKGHENPMAQLRYFLATMDGAKMQYLFDPENFPITVIKKYIIQQFIDQDYESN